MPIKIGSTGIGSLYLGSTKITEAYLGSTKVYDSAAGDYILRLKFSEGVTPAFTKGSATQISSSPNIWDWRYSGTNWSGSFMNVATRNALLEVISGNTQSVTNMSYWFMDCISLPTIPLLDTSSVTHMVSMFSNCSSLTSIPLLDTSLVTSMITMFNGCSSLTTIPLLDTSSVREMSNMFLNCSSLTSIPLLNTSSATNMNTMLKGCTHLAQSGYDLYTAAYSLASSKTASFSHINSFGDCGSLSGTSRLSSIYATWGGTKNGNNVYTTVKTSKQLWTISGDATGSAPWGLDKPLYLHGPSPFSTNSPTISRSNISWTGTAKTGSLFVYPSIIQFNSGSSGSLSFIRQSNSWMFYYSSDSTTTPEFKREITATQYPITAGSYNSSKTLYFGYVVYVSLSNYGLQSCTSFNTNPTLYWTY